MSDLNTLRVEGGVALLTLKRPHVMNAINDAFRVEPVALFPALHARDDAGAVSITGERGT